MEVSEVTEIQRRRRKEQFRQRLAEYLGLLMNYLTNDMARAVDLEKPPYRNLKEYLAWKQR